MTNYVTTVSKGSQTTLEGATDAIKTYLDALATTETIRLVHLFPEGVFWQYVIVSTH